ncbi:hypothetical protein HNR22_002629 [Micromonospora jinlongensis]|uniref:Uncharacterized protein n=1 Tax=Micromonospora jinlongensis TaxID=1287877 RepID=A0A7Y9X0D7_9ACTN|nr:hypothetical protein [Micromonospora jinlongensis]NYH42902.1 hypothetical protein [Micromonospora jinlongensis]
MAKHRASGDDQLTRQGVIDTPGAAYWSVDDSRWPAVRPDLPAHLVDLLAPPIVVGVARVPVTSRLTPPASADPLTSAVDSGPTDLVPSTAASPVPALPVPALPVSATPVPSAAAPAQPAPPPPAPAPSRPVPTPPLSPRPVPSPPPERPVPGPPASPRRAVNTGPVGTARRGNGGPATAGRHRRGASDRTG